jgi:hypothetical protein
MKCSNDTKLKDYAPYALATPQWYLPLGVLLEIIAWTMILVLYLYYIHLLTEIKRFDANLIRFVFSLTAVIFLFILSIARCLRVNTRKKLLDDRPPILYLRPFFHEHPEILFEQRNEVFSYGYQESKTFLTLKYLIGLWLPGGRWPNNDSISTTDSSISKALNEIGPVVAVGIPYETLPSPGALRLYFKDEEWQEKVEALMAISRIVIIQPGYSSSIDWEMATIRQNFRPENIYISFLDWMDLEECSRKSQFEIFNLQLKRIYGISLPEHFHDAYLVCFNDDWKPFKVTPKKWVKISLSSSFSGMTTSAVRETLRPVLQKRGIKLCFWKTVAQELVLKIASGVIFFGFLYLLFRFGK